MEKQTVENLTDQQRRYYGYKADYNIWSKMLKFSIKNQVTSFENQKRTK